MACATTQESRTYIADEYDLATLTGNEAVKSVRNWRMRGWQYLDNKSLIIEVSAFKHYLVTLDQPVKELRFAQGVALDQVTGSRLNTDFDRIYVLDDGIRIPYRIDSIHLIGDRKAVQKLRDTVGLND